RSHRPLAGKRCYAFPQQTGDCFWYVRTNRRSGGDSVSHRTGRYIDDFLKACLCEGLDQGSSRALIGRCNDLIERPGIPPGRLEAKLLSIAKNPLHDSPPRIINFANEPPIM